MRLRLAVWGVGVAVAQAGLVACAASEPALAAFQVASGVATGCLVRRLAGALGPDEAIRAGLFAACFPLAGALGAACLLTAKPAPERRLIAGLEELQRAEECSACVRHASAPPAEAEREYSVWVLAEALRTGPAERKIAAVAALTALEERTGVEALHDALGDPDPRTRLVASLELVKLEEKLARTLALAREAAGASALAPMAIAIAARRYADSGLAHGPAARALWIEAEQAAARALAIARDDAQAIEALIELAKARRGQGNLLEALDAAERALQLAPCHPEALWVASACHYDRGDFARWRASAALLGPSGDPACWDGPCEPAPWPDR